MTRARRQSQKPESVPAGAQHDSGTEAPDYRGRPVEYCEQRLGVQLTPTQEEIARLLVRPPYKVLVRAGHNVGHSDAARTDVQYSLLWDRHRRALVPELVVFHLESESAPVGANWCGRTTRRFGPPPQEHPAEAKGAS